MRKRKLIQRKKQRGKRRLSYGLLSFFLLICIGIAGALPSEPVQNGEEQEGEAAVTGPSGGGEETVTGPSGSGEETVTDPSGGGEETVTDPSGGREETVTGPSGGGEEIVTDPSGDGEEIVTDPSGGEGGEIPPYAGQIVVVCGDNRPDFGADAGRTDAFETYSELDGLGRCGVAYANVCVQLMPTQERGEIGQIRPSGWHTVKYDCIPDRYLYNRCHLIGYQLCGENDNERNLITGTRYFNMSGMLPYENKVAEYVRNTGNHVLYRVTPVFTGENLVADGVHMEAWSVEDRGEGVCFDVFVYNVQPGILIDYATGESAEENRSGQS